VNMPFSVDKQNSEVIHYAVGQPMGAYSSWASLALTHHMIVQSSTYKDTPVRKYAILGDDVIVSDEAPKYLQLMEGLGVSISLAKSIVSKEFVEFAKRVRTLKGEDYSIIGPGLIMSSVRNRFLSAVVLADSIRKDIIRWTAAPKVFLEMPGRTKRWRGHDSGPASFSTFRTPLDYGSWVLFGPKGLISRNLSFALSQEGNVRVTQDLKHESFFFKVQMREYLQKQVTSKWTDNKRKSAVMLNSLRTNLWSIPRGLSYGWSLCILYYIALWCTPIPWLLIAEHGRSLESVNPWDEKQYMTKWYIDDIIFDALDGFEELNIIALEPLTRQEANNILRFWDGLLGFDPDKGRRPVPKVLSEREKSLSLGPMTPGHTVPQYSGDGENSFKPFDINDI
jgi:hypothetical protein